MTRMKEIWRIVSAMVLLACLLVSCRHRGPMNLPVTARDNVRLVETGDGSFRVEGFRFDDEASVVVRRSMPFFLVEHVFHEGGVCVFNPDSIPVRLIFDDLPDSCHVEADVYEVGAQTDICFYFEIGGRRMDLRSCGSDWAWRNYVVHEPADTTLDELEFHVAGVPDLYQDDLPEILDAPFIFKDVDFDGAKELLLRWCCDGRRYYAPYKLLGGVAEQMTGRPYGNLVAGSDDVRTTFDYAARTITIDEYEGMDDFYHHVFRRRGEIVNPLDPMVHDNGFDRESYATGMSVIDNYRDGEACSVEYLYPDEYSNSSLRVIYKVAGEAEVQLDSVVFSKEDRSRVLFPVKQKKLF